MRRFPHKQTSYWRRLLQNWCFQGVLTFVEKYGEEKVNNQHLLLNSADVVVFFMNSNSLLSSSNYVVVKSHLFLSLSAKTTIFFAQVVKGLKKPFCFFSVTIHPHQIFMNLVFFLVNLVLYLLGQRNTFDKTLSV